MKKFVIILFVSLFILTSLNATIKSTTNPEIFDSKPMDTIFVIKNLFSLKEFAKNTEIKEFMWNSNDERGRGLLKRDYTFNFRVWNKMDGQKGIEAIFLKINSSNRRNNIFESGVLPSEWENDIKYLISILLSKKGLEINNVDSLLKKLYKDNKYKFFKEEKRYYLFLQSDYFDTFSIEVQKYYYDSYLIRFLIYKN